MKKILCLCFLLTAFLGNVKAIDIQQASETLAQKAPLPKPTQPDLEPKVIMIQTLHVMPDQKTDAAKEVENIAGKIKPQVAYPGNIIRFTITNPSEFLKNRPLDHLNVVMYVNGKELKGIATGWFSSLSNEQIKNGQIPLFKNTADIDITLARNDSTQEAWNYFYNNTGHFFDNHLDIDASIGWEHMTALAKDSAKTPQIRVIYYSSVQFIIWMAFFIIVFVGFGFLAFNTNAIREGDKNCAFSLSLTQLLFWTTLIIGAFIYTLVLTDITSSFNPSVLYMLGISLTTTGVAGTIDARFNKTNPGSPQKPHHNFFQDVLTSDGTNYSVQRIQIFAWNLLLGIYFISYTINNKSMPLFSSTLLFLAGFSSLSYLGAKPPENTTMKESGEPVQPTVAPLAQQTNTTETSTNSTVAVG